MNTFIVVLLILVSLLVALAALASLARRLPGNREHYRLRARVLSRAELNAWRVLLLAKPPELLLLASVRLADVIQPAASRRGDFQGYRRQLNRIIQKQLDFLLCDPQTTRPLLAIELQDSSHNSEKRRQRDAFITEALHGAGLPLLLLRAAHDYSVPELRQQIADMLECSKNGQKGIQIHRKWH